MVDGQAAWLALSPWPGPFGPNAVALAARSGTAGVDVGAGEEVAGAGLRWPAWRRAAACTLVCDRCGPVALARCPAANRKL